MVMVDRLRIALGQVGVPARPTGEARGPQVTLYRFEIAPALMEKAVRNWRALEAGANIPRISVRQRGGELEVGVPNPRPEVVTLGALGPALGVTPTGGRIAMALDGLRPHCVVGGMSGSGKTALLRTMALLESRAPLTRLVLVDLKDPRDAFDAFDGTGHLVARTDAEAMRCLTWASERIGRPVTGERIVVFIDEAAALPPAGLDMAIRVAEQGRASRVHLVVATQHPDAKTLPRRLLVNADWRIAGRVRDNSASRVVLDQVGAERLGLAGDFLITRGGAPAIRFQGAIIGPGDWQRIRCVAPLGELPPLVAPEPIDRGADQREDDEAIVSEALAQAHTTGEAPTAKRLVARYGIGTTRARRVRDEVARLLGNRGTGANIIPFPDPQASRESVGAGR